MYTYLKYPKISSIQFANKNKINRSRKSNLIAPLSRSSAGIGIVKIKYFFQLFLCVVCGELSHCLCLPNLHNRSQSSPLRRFCDAPRLYPRTIHQVRFTLRNVVAINPPHLKSVCLDGYCASPTSYTTPKHDT